MTDRWATFDCYGTLIDWSGGIRAALQTLWPQASSDRLLAQYHVVEPLVQSERALPYREVGARAVRAIAAIEALPLDGRSAYTLADSLPTWPAFDDVPDALEELRHRGWKLAILSNTDPDLLAASLVQIGVPIDAQITAAEAGSYKPAHGHWRRFFELTGADPRRHVHVGASPFHDLAPAHELGLNAVWINRLDEQSDAPRDAELTDCRALPVTLDALVAA